MLVLVEREERERVVLVVYSKQVGEAGGGDTGIENNGKREEGRSDDTGAGGNGEVG